MGKNTLTTKDGEKADTVALYYGFCLHKFKVTDIKKYSWKFYSCFELRDILVCLNKSFFGLL